VKLGEGLTLPGIKYEIRRLNMPVKSSWRMFFFLIIGFFLFSCAPAPEKLLSPSLSLESVDEVGGDAYRFVFSAGLRNENGMTAFTDLSGEVVVNSESGRILFRIPFDIPVILPFDTALIEKEFTRQGDDAMSLLDAFDVDRERLAAEKRVTGIYIDESRTVLKGFRFSRKNIVSYLKTQPSK